MSTQNSGNSNEFMCLISPVNNTIFALKVILNDDFPVDRSVRKFTMV